MGVAVIVAVFTRGQHLRNEVALLSCIVFVISFDLVQAKFHIHFPPMGTLGTCPGPPAFFLFEGPPTGCGEINFLKLIILLPSQ